MKYKTGWKDFLVFSILLPLVHANIFTLLVLPRAGQFSQHKFSSASSPTSALGGEGGRAFLQWDQDLGSSGGAQRCPGHPDPQFWQRRSLSAATPRKFPPEIGSLPWGQAGFDGTVGQPGKALPRGLTFTSSHHSDPEG